MKPLISLLLVGALSACASPVQDVALPNTPTTWTESNRSTAPDVEDRWWLAYGDPTLDRIMAMAVDADAVEIAEARLSEARAGLRSAGAALAPQLTGSGSVESQKSGDDPPRQDISRAALGLSWSPDLFGANRARARSASANVAAAEAQVAATRLETRLVAVHLYVAFREAQNQNQAAGRIVSSLEETLHIADVRHRAGLVPDLDVAQARAALAAAQARPTALSRAEIAARLSLESLLGLAPGSLKEHLLSESEIPVASSGDALLAPAAVLARRPDLRVAGHMLEAAGFDADAARADFWPKVSLTGLLGTQTVTPPNLFTGSGQVLNGAAALAGPIISFGRLEAAQDSADARLRVAALTYRRAVTSALSGVEQALAATVDAEARLKYLDVAFKAAREQADLARVRYTAGIAPLLDVLVAERAAFDAEDAIAQTRADAARAFADLSAEMGRGGNV